jgi:hypothetical protein
MAARTWNSSRPAGVVVFDRLIEHHQINPERLKLPSEGYEMVRAPGETVELHACDHVNLPCPGGSQQHVKGWAALLRSRDTVIYELDSVPVPGGCKRAEYFELSLGRLVCGRDPRI